MQLHIAKNCRPNFRRAKTDESGWPAVKTLAVKQPALAREAAIRNAR